MFKYLFTALLTVGCLGNETFIEAGEVTDTTYDYVVFEDLAPLRILKFNVPDELTETFGKASEAYLDQFGLLVERSEDGIPIVLQDKVTWGGTEVDAVAHYDQMCSFDECNSGHGVYIKVSRNLLTTKLFALDNTIQHEIGHIVSGWGVKQHMPQHLDEMAGVMSPGCRNHVCADWSEADRKLICAVAPCNNL